MGYIVGGCNVQSSYYIEHDRHGLSCLYAETVECMSLYGVYGLLELQLCCEILLLLIMHGRYGLWSEQC